MQRDSCEVRAAGEVITGSQASQCNRAWSSRYSAGNREVGDEMRDMDLVDLGEYFFNGTCMCYHQ